MKFSVRTGLLVSVVAMGWAGPAFAQAPEASGDEIIVTARKRDETSISVPVALTAVGNAELERRAINSMDGLARVVPALTIGDNAAQQGGIVAIRGLAGADTNPFGDQAVSFNIDGVGIGRASVRRMAEMDIQQIEVLKGPQALFFGKNSPAGIISIRTADPTPTLQAKVSAGYEFKADEVRTDGFISGPLSDTLGVRLAGYFSDMKGWTKNIAPTGPGIAEPTSRRSPNAREAAGRLTLKWEPDDRFNARFKLSYGQLKNDGPTPLFQPVNCPLGTPQGSSAPENCKADDITTTSALGPRFGELFNSHFGDGHTYLRQNQLLGGLELNYNIADKLTLTSVTGLYQVRTRFVGNFTDNFRDTGAVPKTLLGSYQRFTLRELTEELRLTSNFDGRFNFMMGALVQDTKAKTRTVTAFNPTTPSFSNSYRFQQDGTAFSAFAQGMIDIAPTVELSLGGRYSHEKKKLPVALSAVGNNPDCPGLDKRACTEELFDITGPNFERSRSFNNFSPEATLTWRPSQTLTMYGSWKKGFLSGGFNANNPIGFVHPTYSTPGRSTYDQQTIEGFEAGIKAALLGGALRTNFALYSYKTKGLQVTVTTQGTQVELRNAGSVRTKGAEFDFTYRTPLEGLTLNGAVAYNKGTYLDYQASCYRGQSSDTCFVQPNRAFENQLALLQDLSGTRLVRAPRWTGNAGFSYETPVTSGMKLGLSGNMSFSSGFFTQVTSSPGSWQKHYALFDATVRLAEAQDKWELALIGRNLTDKYYFVRSSDIPFTGSTPGGAPVGTLGDTGAVPSRGREIMLRATVRFGS